MKYAQKKAPRQGVRMTKVNTAWRTENAVKTSNGARSLDRAARRKSIMRKGVNMYRMSKSGFFLTVFLLSATFVFAQNAQDMDALLATETVSYEQAAWFVLGAADAPDFSGSAAEAFRYAAERNWLPAKAEPDGMARLDGVSLLVMQSHGINGGFMYTLTKSPRYAYRELVYLNIIQGRTDPEMTVSGDLLLFILTRVFYFQGDLL